MIITSHINVRKDIIFSAPLSNVKKNPQIIHLEAFTQLNIVEQ